MDENGTNFGFDFSTGEGTSGNPPAPTPSTSGSGGTTNSAFVTGLNTLFLNPSAFFNILTGSDVQTSGLTDAQVKQAATQPVTANLPTTPLWLQIGIVGGIVVAGLWAVAFIAKEV